MLTPKSMKNCSEGAESVSWATEYLVPLHIISGPLRVQLMVSAAFVRAPLPAGDFGVGVAGAVIRPSSQSLFVSTALFCARETSFKFPTGGLSGVVAGESAVLGRMKQAPMATSRSRSRIQDELMLLIAMLGSC